jgi:hypothetical protein
MMYKCKIVAGAGLNLLGPCGYCHVAVQGAATVSVEETFCDVVICRQNQLQFVNLHNIELDVRSCT